MKGFMTAGRSIMKSMILAFAFAFVAGAAQAANDLTIGPASVAIDHPEQISLDLTMDFSDSTSGGGIEISYDATVLSLVEIVFDGALPDDPDFRCPGSTVVSCPATPRFLSIGSFVGLSGQHRIASLVFDSVADGSTVVSATVVNAFDDGAGSALDVGIQDASIQVPEPGLGMMLGAGLAALCAFERRRRTRGLGRIRS